MTEELLYNRLELVPGVDVKGMVIDPFSKDAWEINIGEIVHWALILELDLKN